MFDLKVYNKLQPTRGRILISEPFLDDKFFSRSVVFLCEHNDEGTFGFVLNNYLELSSKEVSEQLPDMETRFSVGGPVKTSNLYYLHTAGEEIPGASPVFKNIFVGGDFDVLKSKLESGELAEDQVRFFVGYAGWAPGQLDHELMRHSWMVCKLEKSMDVMDCNVDDLWTKYMKSQGGRYKAMSNFPSNPQFN